MASIPKFIRKRYLYLCPKRIDLRKGIGKMESLIEKSGLKVRKGNVFVFMNKSGTLFRVLERNGKKFKLIAGTYRKESE